MNESNAIDRQDVIRPTMFTSQVEATRAAEAFLSAQGKKPNDRKAKYKPGYLGLDSDKFVALLIEMGEDRQPTGKTFALSDQGEIAGYRKTEGHMGSPNLTWLTTRDFEGNVVTRKLVPQ